MRRRFNALLFVVVAMGCATPARIPRNRYGLEVVPDLATYERLARIDPDKKLVDVQQFVPGLVTDVRYATSDNFMHQELYPLAVVFLRRPAAEALRDVQSDLATRGLGLEVFDGYRPYRVTERMWEPIRNPDFVADPAKGSRHNRGAAVDLTIIDRATGREVPTPYDHFHRSGRAGLHRTPCGRPRKSRPASRCDDASRLRSAAIGVVAFRLPRLAEVRADGCAAGGVGRTTAPSPREEAVKESLFSGLRSECRSGKMGRHSVCLSGLTTGT